MALVLADRVKETTTTTGTATYTLAGASTGFESFASIGDANTTYYACTDGTDFEVGIGTYTASGTTLARTTILQSSNSDSAVSWSSGTKTIFCCQPAEKAVFLDASGNIAAFNGSNLTNVDASQLDSQAPAYYLNYNNFTNTPTIPTNNNELTNGAGYITSADGGNAQTLDSLDSTQFLRSDAQDDKTSGTLRFTDNVQAAFGSSYDLKLYHDSNDSYITNKTGHLYIGGNSDGDVGGNLYLRAKVTENDTSIVLNDDSTIDTYINGSLRMQMFGSVTYSYADIRLQGSAYDLVYDKGVYTTTLTSTDPTSQNQTITLPDATGTVLLTDGDGSSLTGVTTSTLNGQNASYYLNYNNFTNTPSIPTAVSDLTNDSGFITSVPAQSFSSLTGKPTTISGYGITDAFDGAYSSLTGTPTIPTVNDGQITLVPSTGIKINGDSFGKTFTMNQSTSQSFNITTDLSELDDMTETMVNSDEFIVLDDGTNKRKAASEIPLSLFNNDSGFITSADGGNAATLDSLDSTQFLRSDQSDTMTGDLTLTSTDGGATENPTLDLYRNSSSPADNDVLGHINFTGENDAGEKIQYAEIESRIIDASDGNEDGRLVFSAMLDGTNTNYYSPSFGSNIFFRNLFLSQSTNIVFEGSTDDANETTLSVIDPTSDNTVLLPDASGTVALQEQAYQAINAQTGTTYTTVLADGGKLVTLSNASAITLTIPPNSSVAYPVGTKLDFIQIGAGQVTVAGGTGVTVNSTPTLKFRAQHSGASCIKIATDTWQLVGDLAAS